MRMFKLEIKRVCRTRITWILLCVAAFLAVFLAYIPVTFEAASVKNDEGVWQDVTGLDAVHYFQGLNQTLYGEVTPETVTDIVRKYQAVLGAYDVVYAVELPEGVFAEELQDISPYMSRIREAMADLETGIAPLTPDIDIEETPQFYERLEKRLVSVMDMENKEHPAAKADALKRFSEVQRPYTYYYGASHNSMDYEIILIFLITILCVVIAAPVFSADYQTGADDIIRCTKHGRLRLAAVKILSALCITSAAFLACLTVWIVVTNSLFGWEGTKTSMQMLFSVTALPAYTVGNLQWANMWYSFLFFAVTISFTLFLSSRVKNNMMALAFGLLFALLPIITYAVAPAGCEEWLQVFLPSGGIGLMNAVLYALTDYNYLHIGGASIWNVELRTIIAAIEIPLFIGLALWSYCRRKA